MSAPPAVAPLEGEAREEGWLLWRPVVRGDVMLRRVQRFLAVCLVGLAAGLGWMASLMPTAADVAVAVGFAAVCLGGALAVGGWMGTVGVGRIERRGGEVVVEVAGFFGWRRRRVLAVSAVRRVVGRRTVRREARGPVPGWVVAVEATSGSVGLGFLPGRERCGSGPASLAAALGVAFEVVDA